MIAISEENSFKDRSLSVFDDNLSIPRHRWYEFKEGFSAKLVRSAIEENWTSKRKPFHLLDPFCGSGTTLVSAGGVGAAATGVEVNPFMAFASRAKIVSSSEIAVDMHSQVRRILSSSTHELRSKLEGVSTFTKRPGLEKWLFNTSVLRGYTALDAEIRRLKKGKEPLRLALLASLMDCCNAKRDGKCLRYKKHWQQLGYTSREIRDAFSMRATDVADDLVTGTFDSRGLSVVEADTRAHLRTLPSGGYDLVVTSPPYLNSFDYSDIYRPEMFAGGFVSDNECLRKIRHKTVRSHVQVDWEASAFTKSAVLNPILRELRERELWSKKLPDMVESYFHDMETILGELYRVVRRGGECWIVVSTSAYAGIEIPVDLVLAEIATMRKWNLRSINVLRQLRAAGQHWSHVEGEGRLPLRESLIILKKG